MSKATEVFNRGQGAGGSAGAEHADEYPSQWAAIVSIAEKIGCSDATLRSWEGEAAAQA